MVQYSSAPSALNTMNLAGGTGQNLPGGASGWQGSVLGTMEAANQGGFGGLAAAMAGQGGALPQSTYGGMGGGSGSMVPGGGGNTFTPTSPTEGITDRFHAFSAAGDARIDAQFQGGGGGGGSGGGGFSQGGGDDGSRVAMGSLALQSRKYEEGKTAAASAAAYMPRLIESYNKAYGEAREANESRYQQMLKLSRLSQLGEDARIKQAFKGREASMMQGLRRKGMAGTTVAPAMKTGITRERTATLSGMRAAGVNQRLGIMERKEDRYPESGLIASLASAIMGSSSGGLAGTSKALSGLRLS